MSPSKLLSDENSVEKRELLKYKIILENQIYCNIRKKISIYRINQYSKHSAPKNVPDLYAKFFISELYSIVKNDTNFLELLEKKILNQEIERFFHFLMD